MSVDYTDAQVSTDCISAQLNITEMYFYLLMIKTVYSCKPNIIQRFAGWLQNYCRHDKTHLSGLGHQIPSSIFSGCDYLLHIYWKLFKSEPSLQQPNIVLPASDVFFCVFFCVLKELVLYEKLTNNSELCAFDISNVSLHMCDQLQVV